MTESADAIRRPADAAGKRAFAGVKLKIVVNLAFFAE